MGVESGRESDAAVAFAEVLRVSGLYGYVGSREKGTNFVEGMIALAREGKPIRVVDDQLLTPTSTMDVAAQFIVRRSPNAMAFTTSRKLANAFVTSLRAPFLNRPVSQRI